MQKCSHMRTPRLSRRLPAVRLGYITLMHWPRGPGKTPYRDSEAKSYPDQLTKLRRWRERERQRTNVNTLYVYHAFLYISLLSPHNNDLNWCEQFYWYCELGCMESPLFSSNLVDLVSHRCGIGKSLMLWERTGGEKRQLGSFRATHVNRKWAFFSFNMPWRCQICIAECLYSYRVDLPKNLFKITDEEF